MVGNLLVAVDGSEGSRKAIDMARQIAAGRRLHATLVHVLEPPMAAPFEAYGLTMAEWQERQMKEGQVLLENAAHELGELDVDRVLSVGNPGDAVCDEAEKRNVDLVIVGCRGLGRAGRWLLGSVSDRVVHHSSKPVLVVH
jgi:nucleotide-binding universal stress UspA family protein